MYINEVNSFAVSFQNCGMLTLAETPSELARKENAGFLVVCTAIGTCCCLLTNTLLLLVVVLSSALPNTLSQPLLLNSEELAVRKRDAQTEAGLQEITPFFESSVVNIPVL